MGYYIGYCNKIDIISVFNDPVLENIYNSDEMLARTQKYFVNLIHMQVIQFATILVEINVVVVNDLIK